MIVPASTRRPAAAKVGRHRVQRGDTCPDTGRIVGRTPAQFKAKTIIRQHGGDLEPRTRRAR